MNKREINIQLWVRRILLVVLDSICIMFAGFFALATRFEFMISEEYQKFMGELIQYMPIFVVLTLVIFMIFRIYSSLWEYAGLEELYNICIACLISGITQLGIIIVTGGFLPRSYYILQTLYLVVFIAGVRFSYRFVRMKKHHRSLPWKTAKNVMIIGAGEAGHAILTEMQNSQFLNHKVRCIIDDNSRKVGSHLRGVRIVGNRYDIKKYVEKYNIQEIIIAIPSASAKDIKPILDICKETECELRILPGIYQMINGEVNVSKLRPVSIDDLLGREEVKVNLEEITGYLEDKTVLVTGGGGSIGSELCRQIAQAKPKHLIILDIYENNAYEIQQELRRNKPELNLTVLIGSVRDANRMNAIFEEYRPEIVYHAAAHKHVPLMEKSPNEAIKNNVLGTYNVVRMADHWGVKKFVQISTDKAVNPTNIMGASKRICEMIVQTFNEKSNTEFVAVRFGNVLGSNGSVIPLFKKQIAEGGPVTVTHENIIRYFMTIPEAVSLVLQAGSYAKGGEIFVLDMGEPVRIMDLAKNMIRLSGLTLGKDIEIKITGLRPGEKLFEELLMDEEGMTETPSKRIFIGHQIDVDEARLMKTLRVMEEAAEKETDDMRLLVESIVPTYRPKR